jgi:hypothetical protein
MTARGEAARAGRSDWGMEGASAAADATCGAKARGAQSGAWSYLALLLMLLLAFVVFLQSVSRPQMRGNGQ